MKQLKEFIKHLPLIGKPARNIWARINQNNVPPLQSAEYWESRYQAGGTSGEGSYGRLAEFKAEFLNDFVAENHVQTVIELGCGDGNQLTLARYPQYIGLDVSKTAVTLCQERFQEDHTKSFFRYDPFNFVDNHQIFYADLAMSLDVIYHLLEDKVYEKYMEMLFKSAKKYVIIYSYDHEQEYGKQSHVRTRKFSTWITANQPSWSFIKKIENRYPTGDDGQPSSGADFHIYQKSEKE